MDSLRQLRNVSREQALTLEFPAAAATDSAQMRNLRSELKDLDIGLAFDDFSAGPDRFAELVPLVRLASFDCHLSIDDIRGEFSCPVVPHEDALRQSRSR